MKHLFGRIMAAVLLLFAVPALSGCATVQSATGLTPSQNLYRAHGLYNVALGASVNYAESSFASPSVVHQMVTINRQAKPAFEYAEAVIACAGPSESGSLIIKVANARCMVLDISPQNVSKQAGLMDFARGALSRLLGKG